MGVGDQLGVCITVYVSLNYMIIFLLAAVVVAANVRSF